MCLTLARKRNPNPNHNPPAWGFWRTPTVWHAKRVDRPIEQQKLSKNRKHVAQKQLCVCYFSRLVTEFWHKTYCARTSYVYVTLVTWLLCFGIRTLLNELDCDWLKFVWHMQIRLACWRERETDSIEMFYVYIWEFLGFLRRAGIIVKWFEKFSCLWYVWEFVVLLGWGDITKWFEKSLAAYDRNCFLNVCLFVCLFV